MSGAPVVPQGALSIAERDALQDLVNAVLALRRRQAVIDGARAELPELADALADAEHRCRTLGLITGRRRSPRPARPAPRPHAAAPPPPPRPEGEPPSMRDLIVQAVAGGATTARDVIAQVGAVPTSVYPSLTQLANAGVLARVRVDGTGWVYSIPPEGDTDA